MILNDKDLERFRVPSGRRVSLKSWDPEERIFSDKEKEKAQEALKELREELRKWQSRLYAQHRHQVLVILQAMDTAGKDSTIRMVFEGVNPQGVRVTGFGVPTPEALDHDFLWRIHPHVPGKGEIAIFNRSHYEDVLVVRVHDLVPPSVWRKRFDHINHFEKLLSDEGTTVLKFFLHISRGEQKKRLQERLDDPRKNWKFQKGDLKERALWPQYMRAYEDVLRKTSTPWAPWYVIPANHKLTRNLLVAGVLVKTLEALKLKYPQVAEDLGRIVIE